jgi:hypothetical protein
MEGFIGGRLFTQWRYKLGRQLFLHMIYSGRTIFVRIWVDGANSGSSSTPSLNSTIYGLTHNTSMLSGRCGSTKYIYVTVCGAQKHLCKSDRRIEILKFDLKYCTQHWTQALHLISINQNFATALVTLTTLARRQRLNVLNKDNVQFPHILAAE